MFQLPEVTVEDILTHLVFEVSAYTLGQFQCFKSLAVHNQFTCGWVQEVKSFRSESWENTVITK